MTYLQCRIAAIATLFTVSCCLARHSRAQTSCPGPPPIRGTANGNIFTEQQEMDLGDAIAEQFERNFAVVRDDHLNAYLDQIAQRLLAQMPPTQMKFRIVLIDVPIVNAFTMPGGRIYVTRRLVEFAQSEDELAAVLSHELGHALTRQPGAEFSRIFRQVLGVIQVGDRADVFLKYNQLLDNVARKHLHFDPEENEKDQLVADNYGIYALTRAGYSPQAMAAFWDRYAHIQGKTGNWLTDLVGATGPNEQRLRRMRQSIPQMPAACIAPHPQTAAAFMAWRQSVITYTTAMGAAVLPASLPGLLWKRQLSPPLESEISNVRFSPDGKYLLAQDDFSVYVLSRDPLKPIFRIPVDGIEPAAFTPDSQSILIWTPALHIEKWNVASEQRAEVHDVVTPRPCIQADVSPDGSIAACVQLATDSDGMHFDLSLLDVATTSPIIAKRHFYDISFRSPPAGYFSSLVRSQGQFHMAFSPDAHYFALSSALEAFAWDLKTRMPLKLSSATRDVMSGGFAFDGPTDVVGVNARDPKKSGSAQFPSGPAGISIPFYRQIFTAPAHGGGILVRPAGDNAVALVDLKTGKSPLASQMPALDVYDSVYARARPDGAIGIYDLGTRREIAFTQLRGHWIGNLLAGEVSPDLKWFAASGKTRGAVWNLANGDRIFHVYGFNACGFSSQDNLYADFIARTKEKRTLGILNPLTGTIQQDTSVDDENVQISQMGMYLLYGRRENGKWNGLLDFEVHDISTGAILWTKRFSNGFPYVAMSPSSALFSLVLPLDSDEAREQRKQDAVLAAESEDISGKGTARLIQILNAQDGKLRGEFAIDTGQGSFAVRQALPAGNWVVVADTDNRALVYSLEGKLAGRLFGTHPAVSDSGGYLVLEGQPGTLSVYDLATLEKREDISFGLPLSFYQFVDKGSKLFAVTADQTAYLFNVDQQPDRQKAN
ncbi:MAG: M48 family metalloprotease [Candidatus Acidiferrales bacterium]